MAGPQQTLIYSSHNNAIRAPERGLIVDRPNGGPLVNGSGPFGDIANASAMAGNWGTQSIIKWDWWLGNYKSSDIPASHLSYVNSAFANVRNNGLKVAVKPLYVLVGADATLFWVLRHIAQMKPTVQANLDIIAMFYMGFVGYYGEQEVSTNGLTEMGTEGTPGPYRQILTAVLDMVYPKPVLVRHPARIMALEPAYVTAANAFTTARVARLGHHNDAIEAGRQGGNQNDNDWNTYAPDSDIATRNAQYAYMNAHSLYVPISGETAELGIDTAPTTYGTHALAVARFRDGHWTALRNFSTDAFSEFNSIKDASGESLAQTLDKKLGYRLRLAQVKIPNSAAPGETISCEFTVVNDGFAAPYGPRGFEFVLRSGGTLHRIPLHDPNSNTPRNHDPRRWLPGTQTFSVNLQIPSGVASGNYETLLYLPDPYFSGAINAQNAKYALPFVSLRPNGQPQFDSATGLHQLDFNIAIGGVAPPPPPPPPPPGGTGNVPDFISSIEGWYDAPSSSNKLNLSAVPDGDLMVLMCARDGGTASWNDPIGWEIGSKDVTGTAGNRNGRAVAFYYRIANNEPDELLVTSNQGAGGSGYYPSAQIKTFRNFDPANSIHAFAKSIAIAESTSHDLPALITTIANCKILAWVMNDNNTFETQAATPPALYTDEKELDTGAVSNTSSVKDGATATTYTGTYTWALAGKGSAYHIAIAPASVAPPATAPTNLQASSPSPTSATLTWNAVANASSYEIERLINTFWIAVGSTSVLSFSEFGLVASTPYQYRVRAINGAGSSDWSTVSLVTQAAPPPPAPPANPNTTVSVGITLAIPPNTTIQQWLGPAGTRLEQGASLDQKERELIRAGMLRLLTTARGQYGPDPDRGNPALSYLHQPITDAIAAVIAHSSLQAISLYEDRVRVDLDAEVPGYTYDKENQALIINLPFVWADTFQPDFLTVTFPLGGRDGN